MGRETSLVLAIEPDSSRADALRQMVRDRLGLELVLVSSPYAAIVAMNRQLPELVLFSSALSDRNQNKVIAHYRSLTDGRDPQTLIIPLLRDTAEDGKQNSRFSFKWKRQSRGSSADVFLDTIASYVRRPEEAVPPSPEPETAEAIGLPVSIPSVAIPPPEVASQLPLPSSVPDSDPAPSVEAAAEPLEPVIDPPVVAAESAPLPDPQLAETFRLVEVGEEVVLDLAPAPPVDEAAAVDSTVEDTAAPAPLEPDVPPVAEPEAVPLPAEAIAHPDEDAVNAELAALFNQYHIDPGSMAIEVDEAPDVQAAEADSDDATVDLSALIGADTPSVAEPGIDPEVHAAEIALIKLEAEQKLGAELERLRLEAVQQREEELARFHAEAAALRQATVAQAREAAEAEARDAWAGELARVRAEAEQTVSEALNRVKTEAEQTLTSEVTRAREEAEQERLAQLAILQAAFERARDDAEAARLSQLAHVQAAEERVDTVARQAREAEAEAAQEREAQMARLHAEAEAVRQIAVARARAEAETEAREALMTELARVRSEAEQTLNDTLNRVRHEAAHTLTAEVSRAREQAEQSRSEELARIQAVVDERVSQATRLAREAAESDAARAFADELARARSQAEQTFASELARVKSEAELVVAERDRARADANVAREADAVRAQVEVEALRQAAIIEARTAAEEAATRAMEREVARVKREAEARVQEEVDRLRAEAERARIEAEHARAARSEAALEAEKVREEARQVEREVERVRAASAEQLQQELERVRTEAERAREAERAVAREEAERLREAAAQDARAVAEAALKAELERVRAESDARIAAEVAQLRTEADEHRATELAELREQMSQVRDAAAQQAQKVAADAIAAEVARANKARMASPYLPRVDAARQVPSYTPPAPDNRSFAIPQQHRAPTPIPHHPVRPQASPEDAAAVRPTKNPWTTANPSLPSAAPPATRKWRVPAIAALILMAAGTASYNWLPVRVQWKKVAEPVQDVEVGPKPPAPVKRAGAEVRLESTPTGAAVTVDGHNRGVAPVTLRDLSVGTHVAVFEAGGISINRTLRVRADQPLTVMQDMTAGFLSIFSRVPLEVLIDRHRAGSTEDGQLLVAPGSHTVVLENVHFNFRSEFTVEIKPSEVTAHTVMLPMGALVVTTDAGAEVFVEGERVGVAPLGPISVPIGTREVVVRHASGEARQNVEIVYGRQSEVALTSGAPNSDATGTLPVQMPPLSAPPSGLGPSRP